jgi:uncharacterized membrane protein YczE
LTASRKPITGFTLFEIGVIAVFLGVAAAVTNVSWSDRATMTNTLAAISGVFLGLYSVIKTEKKASVVQFLLVSILTSLISSLDSLDQTNSPFSSKYILFILSVVVFAGTTTYFATQIE